MSKKPMNVPGVGDRVRLRGKAAKGVLTDIDTRTHWSKVDWDWGHEGPQVVHLHELEKAT